MYGHQLIESLKNAQNIDLEKIKGSMINNIQNSQHFYMGDIEEVFALVGKTFSDGIPYFQDQLWEDAIPPYRKICLHFSVKDTGTLLNGEAAPSNHIDICSKRVLFIDYCTDGLLIYEWKYLPNRQLWSTTLFTVAIKPHFLNGKTVFQPVFPKDFSTNFSEKETADIELEANTIIYCANLSLILLNTKNIVTQEETPPVKLNKKRIKKGKQPLFTYHTLRLKLPGKSRKGNTSAGNGDNTTRLHLCRGHFKTYTAEKPLLGRFTGRYWWQPHARGNKDQGVVQKDYKVELAPA